VTVLIRPEQVELRAGGPNGRPGAPGGGDGGRDGGDGAAGGGDGELAGRVVAYGYHGHDAVVHVRPEHDVGAPVIVVRTVGGSQLAPGSPVTLRARGPVLAWPDSAAP
jgi:TOBE domain